MAELTQQLRAVQPLADRKAALLERNAALQVQLALAGCWGIAGHTSSLAAACEAATDASNRPAGCPV